MGQFYCPNGDNYLPCMCGPGFVQCEGVLEAVSVFNRTRPSRLTVFNLTISEQNPTNITIIPNKFLNKHQIEILDIKFVKSSYRNSLRIEPGAFSYSKNFTKWIVLEGCELSQLDFKFLTGFDSLSTVEFVSTFNVHLAKWTSMPSMLPNLAHLAIHNSTGLNEWETFPSLSRGLKVLDLNNNEIQSGPLDRILNWSVGHSGNTLEMLFLEQNSLTVPPQINGLKNLKYVDSSNQSPGIPVLPNGSLSG